MTRTTFLPGTGLYVNGAWPVPGSIDLRPSGIDFHSGHTFRARLDYVGGMLTVTIGDLDTGASAVQHYNIDIPAVVGGHGVFVGFTGSTGGLTATQEILNWTFNSL